MKKMLQYAAVLLLHSALNCQLSTAHAQGTAFIYQGRLNGGGSPVTGLYDFRFKLYVDPLGNTQVGGSVVTNAIPAANGLFAVAVDFGAGVFTGSNYWLEVDVKTNNAGIYTVLNPLQAVTPTPYAVFANTASNVSGTVSAAQLSGTIANGNLPDGVVTNGAKGVNITGTFSGNGSGVTNVSFSNLVGDAGLSWGIWGSFQLSGSPGVGANPNSVCAADVNGDGYVDLITANDFGHSLTVLTNNGLGVFGFNATLNVGGVALAVTAADVNGDGYVDLICSSFVNDTVGTLTVFTNNGTGSFGLNGTYSVGGYPYSVTAADVNGDGHVDLISSSWWLSTLTVLTNNGSGVFGFNATLPVGGNPRCVTTADVNGDGRVDLISANQLGTLTVLTNNGFGIFGSNATLNATPNVGDGPYSVVAADMNGDGHVDLISANGGAGTLTVLTNNGFGVFGSNATLNVGIYPFSVVAADVNGDGHLDLIDANQGGSSLTVLTNNGLGAFRLSTTLNTGNQPYCVIAADVNHDGHVDLVSANYGSSTLSVFLNAPAYAGTFSGNGANLTSLNAGNISSGTVPLAQLPASVITNGAKGVNITGTFSGNGSGVTNVSFSNLVGDAGLSWGIWGSFQLSGSPGVGANPNSVCAADVNGDGYVDLITANDFGHSLTVLTNNGLGVFGFNATLNVGGVALAVTAADVNGDGYVDLICSSFVNDTVGTLTVFTNNGTGSFGLNGTYSVGGYPYSVTAADVNGDGHVDLISSSWWLSTLTVLTNNGSGVFGFNATLPVGGNPRCVTTADVNGDGRMDLISANQLGTLTVLTNNGFGVFGSNATLNATPNVGDGPYSVVAADMNGDGHVDLISANGGAGTLTVLTNNGFGVFGSNATLNVGIYPFSVVAADVNGDGHLDLIDANQGGSSLTVLTNNGLGAFRLSTTLNTGNQPYCVIAADVNHDGHVDLVSANYGSSTLSVFLNAPAYAGNFFGDGSGLTDLNASQLISGSIPSAVLTSVPAANLTGTLPIASLPAIVVTNTETSVTLSGSFSGNGGGLTGLNAAQLSGSVPTGVSIPSADLTGALPAISGASLTSLPAGNLNGILPAISGANLTSLNASQLSSGVVPQNVLPGFQPGGNYIAIGGGQNNITAVSAADSVISGGQNNAIAPSADHAAIGGGYNNTIGANDYQGTIAGGYYNTILASSGYAAIGGGQFNTNSGNEGVIAGGQLNLASGLYQSTVGGGYKNTASGSYATVPGGYGNVASGSSSFAAGDNATDGGFANSFVWGDGSRQSVAQGANTFNVLATGGCWIFSGAFPAGVKLTAGSSAWATISDRNAKKNFAPVDTKAVLDKLAVIPMQQWNYKWEKDSDVPNIGPMAQDFKAAFYPGRDDKSITTLEFDGVELAAIQGLNQKFEEKDAEIQKLKEKADKVDSLEKRLADLEQAVQVLTARK